MTKIKIYSFDNKVVFSVEEIGIDHEPERQLAYNSNELSICEIYEKSREIVINITSKLLTSGAIQL